MHKPERHILARLGSHLWSADRQMRKAFPAASLQRVEQAVTAAERGHGGELRVVIEGGLGWDALRAGSQGVEAPSLSRARAIDLFAQLGVWDTADNSGVLIYILMATHQLEIVADRGIHAKVGEAVWQGVVADTMARFRQGEYEQGLLHAIDTISQQLRQHFPAAPDDANELPDRPLVL
ncbi:TPM domain-containing protein [Uliginosibacterium sp. H3]|uniref:TPM domain-containing protein n=1 Tax=Uliginosibacterium silvisoli TaxID=3114758 RepID=A0ABU6JZB8_9RHOO|nr:TPM domain-containing protein [Uliginosibacterium sp. H3]